MAFEPPEHPLPLHDHWHELAASAARANDDSEHGTHVSRSTDPTELYINALLTFISTSTLFRNLCGGVHGLDFLTSVTDVAKESGIWATVVPEEWRKWVEGYSEADGKYDAGRKVDVQEFRNLCLDAPVRAMLDRLGGRHGANVKSKDQSGRDDPPKSMLEYIYAIRILSLERRARRRWEDDEYNGGIRARPRKENGGSTQVQAAQKEEALLMRQINAGMKPKKAHEVKRFSAYVNALSEYVSSTERAPGTSPSEMNGQNPDEERAETDHQQPTVIDFGSGQNYLGRTLASWPYDRRVVAVEQRAHNVKRAQKRDVTAKLAEKQKVMRNKKEWIKLSKEEQKAALKRMRQEGGNAATDEAAKVDSASLPEVRGSSVNGERRDIDLFPPASDEAFPTTYERLIQQEAEDRERETKTSPDSQPVSKTDPESRNITYMTQSLSTGHLPFLETSPYNAQSNIVVSIHSCGNLTHYGLRSLTLNPAVRAVAMVGCCYNLVTERLGPVTYKLPSLRPNHPRLIDTENAYDQDGFPLSNKFETWEAQINTEHMGRQAGFRAEDYLDLQTPRTMNAEMTAEHSEKAPSQNAATSSIPNGTTDSTAPNQILNTVTERGIRLNITARMMAVQAVANWTPADSASFFTRHYYRALLQRILLDYGVVKMEDSPNNNTSEPYAQRGMAQLPPTSLSNSASTGTPLILGTLPKSCFTSFQAYVAGALQKLSAPSTTNSSSPYASTQAATAAQTNAAQAARIAELTSDLRATSTGPAIIARYESDYAPWKNRLSILWTLTAFSASVVESAIVTDRYLWVKEQGVAKNGAWVEAVFDYEWSPRNLVVVGVK